MPDYVDKAKQVIASYNPNETVNYNDSRLTSVQAEQAQKEAEVKNDYNTRIDQTDSFYNNLNNTLENNAKTASDNIQAQTNQSISEINQQKAKAERDYQKEQRGAYQDYARGVNPYGINAENSARQGLGSSGYSESANVSMYNTWQNRVATARQTLADIQQNYDNLIAQARISNNTQLADIYAELAKQQAQNAIAGFQYKNTLIESREDRLQTLGTRYDNKYAQALAQINNEIEQRRQNYNSSVSTVQNYENYLESQRQFNEKMAYQREQDEANRRFQAEEAEKTRQFQARQNALSRRSS